MGYGLEDIRRKHREKERERRAELIRLGLTSRGRLALARRNAAARRFEEWLRRNSARLDAIAMRDPIVSTGRKKT